MIMLPTLRTTTSDTDDGETHGTDKRRKARSVHASAEKVLRVVFKAASPGSGPPHRYYRAILRGSGGPFHLAGRHAVLAPTGARAEDTTAGSKPPARETPVSETPLWVKRDVGLRAALHAVNDFAPSRPGEDPHVAVQFLTGRKQCLLLWELAKCRN